jgi:hypothetical protein
VKGAGIRNGAVRAGVIAAGSTLGAVALGLIPLPGPLRAVGMLALPCALFAVLRREDRRLRRAADDIGAGPVRPTLRNLLLGKRRQLDKALHR